MKKVITYGTYDLLHYGHIRLLERAKELGDYLIVGVTSDDFDKSRGKINVTQSLVERIEAVRALNIADEIIVEEYEGQKIDDIKKYGIDIFTVGSDWVGKFDYLKEYCEVVYLERTKGVSSSEIRGANTFLKIGVVGNSAYLEKFVSECAFVNGVKVEGICTDNPKKFSEKINGLEIVTDDYGKLLKNVDAVYVHSTPKQHYEQVKTALLSGKHVICESPITLKKQQTEELFELAKDKSLILQESIRTAYFTAYARMLVLLKSNVIGKVVSVDATCTSLKKGTKGWNSIFSWGPIALLPILDIFGTNYKEKRMVSSFKDSKNDDDIFTKIDFTYDNAVASLKVARGVKSEGELIISGTKGYIYVPSPWWKMSYFEIRYEDFTNNRKMFYQLDGEGLRYEVANFKNSVYSSVEKTYISKDISSAITDIMEDFIERKDLKEIKI